jgi:alpha-tubulin suppressor-like RCC1 family protein
LLETGEVQCWGNNADGECGTGEFGGFAIPPSFVINLPGPVSSIACGGEHTCAVLADNRMACWGWNVVAQIGVTDFDLQIPTPAIIDVGFPVAAAAGGFTHTCALSTAGEVKCWGSNFSGELGQSCGDGCQATYGITPAQLPNIVF